LAKGDGEQVAGGETVANWDPHPMPVNTEVSGFVRFNDMIHGQHITRHNDEMTGTFSRVVHGSPKTILSRNRASSVLQQRFSSGSTASRAVVWCGRGGGF
ncbi:hypothetical protein, partial [Escherichia coli]|uniref:hypothetical protein n=1 Tax=Escherichia coli TaxID=562 RepID=UPI001BAF0C94